MFFTSKMASSNPAAAKAPKNRTQSKAPSVCIVPPTRVGERYFEFRDWFNCRAYWKGNHDLKSLIKYFLTPAQEEKLTNGTFRYILAMENLKCSMKLVHCLCLSRIFTNDRDSISFKIFGHNVSFTLEDFHIMCGLRITAHNVEKPSKHESTILKRYFGKSKGVTMKDIRDFMSRNEIQKDDANFTHVCESDEDAVKLMEILLVESVIFGKRNESTVLEDYAAIVEDDNACATYPWGNVSYEKLITSMKHALDNQSSEHSTEYTIGGFPYPLCVWFYECFPDLRIRYIKEDEYLDSPQLPRMLRYICVGETKYKELEKYFSNHSEYRKFKVLDIIPTEEELNSMPLIGQLPCSGVRSRVVPPTGESPRSQSRPKETCRTSTAESPRTQSRSNRSTTVFDDELVNRICSRVTNEVKRQADGERKLIAKEVVAQFKEDERSAIVDEVFGKVKVYFDEKFQELFNIVKKSNGTDNSRQYDNSFANLSDMNAAHDEVHQYFTPMSVDVEGDQNVEQQFNNENPSGYQPSKVDEHLSTVNIASNKSADDQGVDYEGDAPTGDGDHAPVRTVQRTSSDAYTNIERGNPFTDALAICAEIVLLGEATKEIHTTVEVDTTEKLSEDRVGEILSENTQILLDVAEQLNEAGAADSVQETTVQHKCQEGLDAALKEIGEILRQYEKGEIHIFTLVGSQTDIGKSKPSESGSVQTPSVHLDQISYDASQLLPNPKRRKISISPNVMRDTTDIPKFNICSFSMGSTEGTIEFPLAAEVQQLGVMEQQGVVEVGASMVVESSPAAEVQQLAIIEQQGVVEAGASMAVESSPAAEMQQLVVTEQHEEQPKRKPVKKEKRIRLESIWLKSPYVVPKQKRRGQDWKEGKTARRCPFHYVSRDSDWKI